MSAALDTPLFDPADYRMCESPGYLLIRARAVLSNGLEQQLAGLDITHAQASCLLMLAQNRARTVTDVGREMNIDIGSVTRLISRMEKRGLVRRQRSEADRRIVELVITDQGHALVAQLPAMICRVLNRHFAGFSPEEVDQFKDMLLRIIGNNSG
ncbi:MarR family winged helix-turn-helix transcriptional regulator [Cupriavidus sp. AU9028]|uniref:MarR family winged helix-turn-helix transcriptional regulator n=1 Tax=Cupriavidus sp. AU9028 TaxID=2871157 RepID=UPI001C95E400|nr:MarR family transcriptional regulator [Cupriavidus sp. AU9028]MBY4898073.1 MarR family transcriptional regulator [Cupriavidus sp. AU9028]